MANRSIYIPAIAVFAVFCGTTASAPQDPESSCNEDDFKSCLQKNTDFLTKETEAKDIPALIKKVCRVKVKPCKDILSLDKCPEDFKREIFILERSIEATFEALCEKDASLSKELAKTLECWTLEDFSSCFEKLNVAALGLDLLTPKRSQEAWDNFDAELLKCIDHARDKSEECKGVDVRPVKKVIDSFFAYSKRLNNSSGETCAASILTALFSLFVSLALSRQN